MIQKNNMLADAERKAETEAAQLKQVCKLVAAEKTRELGKRYFEENIAKSIFQTNGKGDENAKKYLSDAKNTSETKLKCNSFFGKTRAEIIEAIEKTYTDCLQKEGYFDRQKQYFTFKQYYMTDTDENVVLAATLLLFYTKNGSQIEFTRYKLTIPNTGTTYPVFTLEGTVKRYADSLVLVHDTAEAYSATIIRAETPFFSIGPTLDSTQYSGAYLTHSSVGEAIAGEILLQRVANDTPIKMDDVPADIQQKLWQTFNKLKPPA